jgi:hypothetical protein
MKIFRGGRTQNDWSDMTDEKTTSAYIENWEPGKHIVFDGTIDKTGKRHTDLGVVIDEEDVIAMHGALIRTLKQSNSDNTKMIEELNNTIKYLREAFAKIHGLINYHINEAPSEERLLDDIKEISSEYMYYHDELDGVDLDWIKWSEIRTKSSESNKFVSMWLENFR